MNTAESVTNRKMDENKKSESSNAWWGGGPKYWIMKSIIVGFVILIFGLFQFYYAINARRQDHTFTYYTKYTVALGLILIGISIMFDRFEF